MIVALPALTPVTVPVVASTVAIVASLDVNVVVALAGLTAALRAVVAPTATTESPDNATVGFLTVALHV